MTEHRAYILDTGWYPKNWTEIFIDGVHTVSFRSPTLEGLKFLLEKVGVKHVIIERAKNKEERQFILEKLEQIWN